MKSARSVREMVVEVTFPASARLRRFPANTYETNSVGLVRAPINRFARGAMWNSLPTQTCARRERITRQPSLGTDPGGFHAGALGRVGLDQAEPNTLFTRQWYVGLYASGHLEKSPRT